MKQTLLGSFYGWSHWDTENSYQQHLTWGLEEAGFAHRQGSSNYLQLHLKRHWAMESGKAGWGHTQQAERSLQRERAGTQAAGSSGHRLRSHSWPSHLHVNAPVTSSNQSTYLFLCQILPLFQASGLGKPSSTLLLDPSLWNWKVERTQDGARSEQVKDGRRQPRVESP